MGLRSIPMTVAEGYVSATATREISRRKIASGVTVPPGDEDYSLSIAQMPVPVPSTMVSDI